MQGPQSDYDKTVRLEIDQIPAPGAPAVAPDTSRPASAVPAIGWAALATIVTIGSGLAFLALIDSPYVRTTGQPSATLMCLGAVLSLIGLRFRPRWPGIIASVLCVAMAGTFVWQLYFVRLPSPAPLPQAAKTAGGLDFSLRDSAGKTWRLSDFRDKGPVLVVFYRGFW